MLGVSLFGRKMRRSLLILAGLFWFTACSDDDDIVLFEGVVRKMGSEVPAANEHLEVVVRQVVSRGNGLPPILTRVEGTTDGSGFYRIAVPRSLVSRDDIFYSVEPLTLTKRLSRNSEFNSCFNNPFREPSFYADFWIADLSFVRVEFDKLDHNTNQIAGLWQCLLVYGTTLAQPDTVLVAQYDFNPADGGIFDLNYFIFSDGVTESFTLEKIQSVKGDTIDIRIEY